MFGILRDRHFGAVVKRNKRPSGETDVCIQPLGSSKPCQWVSSEVIN
jgi:hypothetical protein